MERTSKNGAMFQPRRCWERLARWSAVYLLILLHVEVRLGWWSSLDTSPLAGAAEPPDLELSEVDDPDGEAVLDIEGPPEAPRPPTAGSSNGGHGDPERTVSGSKSRVDILTGKKLCSAAEAILGNVFSVTLKMGKSTDGNVQWHWEMATRRGDHILKQWLASGASSNTRALLLEFCRSGVGEGRPLHSQLQSPNTPVFARLQNSRWEDVQGTLRHLKRVWEALTKCEREV